MTPTRRRFVAGGIAAGLAAPALIGTIRTARAATVLKLSHQFPGGTLEQGDFRDRMCRKFAQGVAERSNGSLEVQVYPGSSLMKTNAQFSAMRKGALDMTLYPLSYAGGEVPETNIGLMPCLVTSYDQAGRWKEAPVGRALAKVLDDKGVLMVTWVWQPGGVASRARPLVGPDDAKGLKVRGGSREMDLMLQAAGAATLNIPSNESYAAMQTGAADAVITSSTSLISFRLEEIAKSLTSGRGTSYWFMLEPIMISKTIFGGLSKDQQDIIMAVGAEMEPFGTAGAREDDVRVEQVFSKAGATVSELDAATVGRWRDIARDTAWKDFAARSESCAQLLRMGESVA